MIIFEKAPDLSGISVTNKHTSGINVGGMLMSVAFADSKEEELLFATSGFNDLQAPVSQLKKKGVADIIMASAGLFYACDILKRQFDIVKFTYLSVNIYNS
jgi:hypothetical protein